jgi:hypothetical protein
MISTTLGRTWKHNLTYEIFSTLNFKSHINEDNKIMRISLFINLKDMPPNH